MAKINRKTLLPQFGKSHALIIGINKYTNITADLRTPINDARRLKVVLTRHQGFEEDDITLLENPTKDEIETALSELSDKVGDTDSVLFYYAGHGVAGEIEEENGQLVKTGSSGYLLPSDVVVQNTDFTKNETLLPMEDVFDIFSELKSHHTLLILDCCFAGTFRHVGNKRLTIGLGFSPMTEARFNRYAEKKAWQVLASSGALEKAADWIGFRLEKKRKYSPFAKALIEALSGMTEVDVKPKGKRFGDGVLTAHELFLYLHDEVERQTRLADDFDPQNPSIFPMSKDDGGQFIFVDPSHKGNEPDWDERKKTNPYMGLKQFDIANSDYFFGREADTHTLVKTMFPEQGESPNMLLVTGASGSGKSSLVKAGLLPHFLEHKSNGEDVVPYDLFQIRPGEKPWIIKQFLTNKEDSTEEEKWEDIMELNTDTLNIIAANESPSESIFPFNPTKRHVLLIDQYEELFTECTKEERHAFEDAIENLFNQSLSGESSIILTLRSDFEWQLKLSDFGKTFMLTNGANYSHVHLHRVSTLGLDDLRNVLTYPAHLLLYEFEHDQEGDLADTILEDLNYLPNALPLLSFTMQAMVEETNITERIFKRETYRKTLGGVNGVLSQHIDDIYDDLIDSQDDAPNVAASYERMMKQLFLRMVNLSDGDYTRRRVFREHELDELGYEKNQEILTSIIEKLDDAQLISIGGEGDKSYLELIHDSLINSWEIGKQWINEFGKENLLLQRQLWQAVVEYRAQAEENTFLWDANPKLQQIILMILDPFGLLLKEKNAQLLAASSLLWNNDVEDENKEKVVDLINWWENQNALIIPSELIFDGDNEIEVNELLDFLLQNASHWLNKLEAEFVLKSWEKRNNRIEQLKKERDNALRKAHANTNALKVLELTKTNATLGIRFAELNYHIYPEVDTALGIFRDIYSNSSLSLFKQKYDLRVVGFSPDNIPLYITHDGTTINLLNVQGKHIQNFNYQGTLSFVKVSSKSKYLMHQSTFSVVIWNISTGSEVFRFNHSKQLGSSSFSFNEKYVLISFKTYEGTTPVGFIRLWEIELQKDVWTVETPSYISAFSSNDKFILSGGVDHRESYKVTLRDINGQEKQSYKGHSSIVWEAALSPDGKYILTGSEDKTAKLWDRYSGEELQNYPHGERVGTVSFSPDGQYIMTGSSDMNVRFWNLQGQELKRFQHINGVSWAKFSPDGSTILTRVFINSVTPRGIRSYLWDIEKSLFQNFSEHIEGHTEWVETIDFSFSRPSESKWPFGEGVYFLTGSEDRTAKLWDAKGQLISSFEGDDGHNNDLQTVAFSPNGNFILTGAKDARAKIWRPDGKILKTLNPEIGRVNCLTFSQDSKYIFIGGSQKVKMYDLGEVLGNIEETIIAVTVFKEEEGRENIWSIALSPDDEYQYLLTGSSNVAGGSNRIHKAKLWNRKTGELTQSFAEHTNTVSSLAFSPDGTHFLTGSKDKTAKLWHIQSKKSILTLKGHAYTINKVSFSPDGNYLLTASEDHTIKIWDIHGREVQTLAGFRSGALGNVLAATFSPDGTYIMAGSRGEVKKWLTPWAYLQEKVHAYTIEELKENGLEFTDKDLAQMNKRGKMW